MKRKGCWDNLFEFLARLTEKELCFQDEDRILSSFVPFFPKTASCSDLTSTEIMSNDPPTFKKADEAMDFLLNQGK